MEKAGASKSVSLVEVDDFDLEWAPEPFSLEKVLRAAPDECASPDSSGDGWYLTISLGSMILILREERLVYISETFALVALAPRRLTKQPLGPCSTPKPSGRGAEMRFGHPRKRFFTISAV